MQKYTDNVVDTAGNALSGATVTVYESDGSTVASIFDESEVATSNPLTTDSAGRYAFAAEDGEYVVQITKTGFTTTSRRIRLFDQSEFDIDISSEIAGGPILRNIAASNTIPSIVPHKGDTTTGLGSDGAGELFAIAGGAEIAGFSSAGMILGNSGARVTTVLDEDTLGSNSDTALATQQSVKAYVDSAVAGGGAGKVELISSQSVSSVANVDFTLPSGYVEFLIVFDKWITDTDDRDAQILVSNDGGSTFRTGATDYFNSCTSFSASGLLNQSASIAFWRPMYSATALHGLGTATDEHLSGWVRIISARDSAVATRLLGHTFHTNAAAVKIVNFPWGEINIIEDNDAIQLNLESAATFSGNFFLYGIKSS